MKKIIAILLISTLVIISCKSKKEIKKAEVKTETTVVKKSDELEDVSNNKEEATEIFEDVGENYIVASIERTVCFGACPTYTAVVYRDGSVYYNGKANVDKIGKFKGKVNKTVVENLLVEVNSIGFMELKYSYDNKFVSDVPSTITYFSYKGRDKKVICRFECDKRIEKINKLFEGFLDQVKYKKVEEK